MPGPATLTSGTITPDAGPRPRRRRHPRDRRPDPRPAAGPARHGAGASGRFDFRGTGLGPAAALARWTLLYVVCNQLVYVVVVKLATSDAAGRRAYCVLSGRLHAVAAAARDRGRQRHHRAAAADEPGGTWTSRLEDLRRRSSTAGCAWPSRCSSPPPSALPSSAVRSRPSAFAHVRTTADEARTIGTLLAVFACGLVAFSSYQLQLRAFYAMQDTRTPTLINLGVNITTVAVDVGLFVVLPDQRTGARPGRRPGRVVPGGGRRCAPACSRAGRRRPRRPRPAHRRPLLARRRAGRGLALTAGVVVARGRPARDGIPAGPAHRAGGRDRAARAGYLVAARRLGIPEVDEVVGPCSPGRSGRRTSAQAARTIGRTPGVTHAGCCALR